MRPFDASSGGGRTRHTEWCDWGIPLHWGGLSDPFQPAEREHRTSLKVLEVLAESGYPFIVSTKGALVAEEPYLSLLGRANAVVQVSMVCSSYDRMEPGAPTFEERLKVVERLAGRVRRVIVRAQPYIADVRDELVANVPRLAAAGAYGLTIEGMKFKKAKPGLVRVRGDYAYPDYLLERHYARIKAACEDAGMAFFCAENRLRGMGRSTACCGCGDLPGFKGNSFNAVSMLHAPAEPTAKMLEVGTAQCFRSIHQEAGITRKLDCESFASQMAKEAKGLAL